MRRVKKIFKGITMVVIVVIVAMIVSATFRGFILSKLGLIIWDIRNINQDATRLNSETYVDRNSNGISDEIDLVKGARKEVKNRTRYKSDYYQGGYPPKKEGVCTDVVWRAFKAIDINLKELMDEDISTNVELYPRVGGNPDPNIDFRRVPNQLVFFNRYAESLTTEINLEDEENLRQWQPGDIVIMLKPNEHVVIISNKKALNGTPYIIHNACIRASENIFNYKNVEIAGHYRWKY